MSDEPTTISVELTEYEARAIANSVNLFIEVMGQDRRLDHFRGSALVAGAMKLESAMLAEGVAQ